WEVAQLASAYCCAWLWHLRQAAWPSLTGAGWPGSERREWHLLHSSFTSSMCAAWSSLSRGSRLGQGPADFTSVWQKEHCPVSFFSLWHSRHLASGERNSPESVFASKMPSWQ